MWKAGRWVDSTAGAGIITTARLPGSTITGVIGASYASGKSPSDSGAQGPGAYLLEKGAIGEYVPELQFQST